MHFTQSAAALIASIAGERLAEDQQARLAVGPVQDRGLRQALAGFARFLQLDGGAAGKRAPGSTAHAFEHVADLIEQPWLCGIVGGPADRQAENLSEVPQP